MSNASRVDASGAVAWLKAQADPAFRDGASDERNFVKKGVSWALRHIGHRNARLHAAAVKTANKLAKSNDRTERWVGKDALRDLQRATVLAKVSRRS